MDIKEETKKLNDRIHARILRKQERERFTPDIPYPAWKVGDWVRHTSNGISGELTEMMTSEGILWKMLPRGAKTHIVVHAKELEMGKRW